MPIQYADRDGDGRPDHVMGPDGLWHAFDPATGQMRGSGSPLSAALREGNSSTGVSPGSVQGGTQGRLPTPTNPPLRSLDPVAPAPVQLPNPELAATPPAMPAMPMRGMPSSAGSEGSSAPRGELRAQKGSPFSGVDFAFNSSGNAGGGGNAHPLYQKFAAKGDALRAKAQGMASNLRSMGTPQTESATSQTSATEPFGAIPEPAEPRMRGWAKGMDPQQAEAVSSNPMLMAHRVTKGLEWSPLYDTLGEIPANSLALLSTAGKKAKPLTSLSKQVNATGDVYTDFLGDKAGAFDVDKLGKQLTRAKPSSALGQLMAPPKVGSALDPTGGTGDYYGSPLTTATSTLSQLIHDIGEASALDPRSIEAYDGAGQYLINKFGAKSLTKSPSRMRPLNRKVGRQLYG